MKCPRFTLRVRFQATTTRRSASVVAWKEATRLWWDRCRHRYDLCTSVLTLNEVAAGPPRKAEQMLALIRDVRVLESLPGTAELIDFYVDHQLMPSGAGGDAGHLAFASMHGVDFLLTGTVRIWPTPTRQSTSAS